MVSIFDCTTFVLTGTTTIQRLLGKGQEYYGSRPLRRQIKYLELAVLNEFTPDMPCCSEVGEELHSPYDFRWLDLSSMTNCRQLNITVNARRRSTIESKVGMHVCTTALNTCELRAAFSRFSAALHSCKVTITSPLGQHVNPENGFVNDISVDGQVQLWKRYTGDKFRAFGARLVQVRADRYLKICSPTTKLPES